MSEQNKLWPNLNARLADGRVRTVAVNEDGEIAYATRDAAGRMTILGGAGDEDDVEVRLQQDAMVEQQMEARIHAQFPGVSETEFRRELRDEQRRWEMAQRLDQLDLRVPQWLVCGLGVLRDDDLAVDPTITQTQMRKLTRALLDEEVTRELADRAEFGDGTTPEQAQVTRTWLAQTDYEVWCRVRYFTTALTAQVADYDLAYAVGDGPDLNSFAEELWREIVRGWYDDLGREDRVVLGKKL